VIQFSLPNSPAPPKVLGRSGSSGVVEVKAVESVDIELVAAESIPAAPFLSQGFGGETILLLDEDEAGQAEPDLPETGQDTLKEI